MDNNSLAHTKWECKYHIVFAPKFRRKVIYQQIRADVGHILSKLRYIELQKQNKKKTFVMVVSEDKYLNCFSTESQNG